MQTQTRKYKMIQSSTPIPHDVMREYCPAIFATEPFSECSNKYRFISTIDALEALEAEGFAAYMVGQTTPKNEDKHDFAKHMIRLRRDNALSGGIANEIILKNSSDRSTAAIMMAGVFRMVCMNGMIAGKVSQEIHIAHRGHQIDDYINGAYTIVNQFEKVDESRERMQQKTLSLDEQYSFVKDAAKLRWPDEEQNIIDPRYLAQTHRYEDLGNDLWTFFNVVQENLIKGGVKGRATKGGIRTIRKVTGLDALTNLNKGLWDLADQYVGA